VSCQFSSCATADETESGGGTKVLPKLIIERICKTLTAARPAKITTTITTAKNIFHFIGRKVYFRGGGLSNTCLNYLFEPCRPPRSAGLQPAVSPICNRQVYATSTTAELAATRGLQIRDTADCKSALRCGVHRALLDVLNRAAFAKA
jgi:hypothetical protein